MSIQVSCPNGHSLRIKDSFAGKTGYCPHCRAKVHVPQPIGFSEDDVISVLGPPPPRPADESESPPDPEVYAYVHQSRSRPKPGAESGVGLAGSSILRRAKRCPHCHTPTSFSFSICPTCGTPLPMIGWRPVSDDDDLPAGAPEGDREAPAPTAEHAQGGSEDIHSTPKKSCLKCTLEIDAGTRICPHCHTYIGGLSDLQGSRP